MKVFSFRRSQIEGLSRLDPEYYDPSFIQRARKVRGVNNETVDSLFNIQLGPAYASSKINTSGEIRIAKIGDVTNKRIVDKWDKLNLDEFFRFGSKNIKQKSILLTMTGDPPDVGKVYMPLSEFEDSSQQVAFNQRVALLSSRVISPYYLFAVLSSEYFRFQFEQCALGIRQRNVSVPDLKSARVFVGNEDEISSVEEKVKMHFKFRNLQYYHYQQAEQLLNEELGFNNIQFKKDKIYRSSFNEVVGNNRFDSDFYQVKYRQLSDFINTIDSLPLSKIAKFKKGFEVGSANYTAEGPTFIRVSNFTKEGFTFSNSDKHISRYLYENLKDFQPEIGDVLLTKDGTIGSCYVVDEKVEGIFSSGILKLYDIDSAIPKEYLALVINSTVCEMQAQRDCSGALILHWKPEDIRKMRIPLLTAEIRQQLADMVIESKNARKESKRLLQEAIQEVEDLIEQNSTV